MVAETKQQTDDDFKRHVMDVLESLPTEALAAVAAFVDDQQRMARQGDPRSTPYRAVKLGGLWAGVEISDEEIADVRREMWGNFGERGF